MTTSTRPQRPAIEPKHPMWFRVMRMFRVVGEDRVQYECLAEYPDRTEATIDASQEPTRAFVRSWNCARVYDNHQPMEIRPPQD